MSLQTLTVLLIEDSPDFAKIVQHWLSQPRGDVEYVLNWTDSLAEGKRRLARGDVSVVLLDLHLPDSEGPATFTAIRSQEIPVIVLSAGDDEAAALEMIQLGAENYLVKSSCNGEVLTRAIRYAVVKHSSQANRPAVEASHEKACVIAVFGGKGGVGATTIACSLAAELRRRTNETVLLADLDLGTGLVSFLMGVEWQYSILDAVANLARLDRDCWQKIVVQGENELDLVCSPAQVGRPELAPGRLNQVLAAIQPFYRWIVLDLGRLNQATGHLLEMVNELLVVTTTAIPALYQTKRIIETLAKSGSTSRTRLIINRIEPLEMLTQQELRSIFGVEVSAILPSSSRELHQACVHRRLPAESGAFRKEIAKVVQKIAVLPEEKSRRVLEPLLSLGRLRRHSEVP